jgi:hypothetical protein
MEITPALLIALTASLVQVIKMSADIPKRFIPLMSLVVGAVMAYLFHLDPIYYLIVGLSASGAYSATKTIAGK